MKKLLRISGCVLIGILIHVAGFAQNGIAEPEWQRIETGYENPLRSVFFMGDNYGWIAGGQYTMLRTQNAGSTWTREESGITHFTNTGVHFVTTSMGYMASENGTILKTTNGGVDWTPYVVGPQVQLRQVFFRTAQEGYAVGDQGYRFKTTDGGTTWMQQNRASFPIFDVTFYGTVGYQVGVRHLYQSFDGGENWSPWYQFGSNDFLYKIKIANSSTSYIAGTDYNTMRGFVYKTDDGGASWIKVLDADVPLKSLAITDPSTVFAVGGGENGGVIYSTTSGGSSWNSVQPEGAGAFEDITLTMGGYLYAVGDMGSVYRFDINQGPVTEEITEIEPNDSPEQAHLIPLYAQVSGNLGTTHESETDENDYFRIDVPEDGHFQMFFEESETLASAISLWTADFNKLLATGKHGVGHLGGTDTLNVPNLTAGTYLILIYRDTEGGSGDYQFKTAFQLAEFSGDLEPNNDISTATPIEMHASVQGLLGFDGNEPRDEVDVYGFSVFQQVDVLITLQNTPTLQSVVELVTSDGYRYMGEVEGEAGFGQQLSLRIPVAPGDYTIHVSALGYETGYGGYTLALQSEEVVLVFESTAEGGLWHEGTTWIGGIAPPHYGADIVINGPVVMDESAEAENLIVNRNASLTVQSVGKEYPVVDLMVMKKLLNDGGLIYSDNAAMGEGFTVNVMGEIENTGVIAVNELRFASEGDQIVNGVGVFGYSSALPHDMSALSMYISKYSGNIDLVTSMNWNGVSVMISEPGELRISPLCSLTLTTPEGAPVPSSVMFTNIRGGDLQLPNQVLFLASTLTDLSVNGGISFIHFMKIAGTVGVSGNIEPYPLTFEATKLLARPKMPEVTFMPESQLAVEGDLTVIGNIQKPNGFDGLFMVMAEGNVDVTGAWHSDVTFLVGAREQTFSLHDNNILQSELIVSASMPQAELFQWYLDGQILEGQTSHDAHFSAPVTQLRGRLWASSPIGNSRNIFMNIQGEDVNALDFAAQPQTGRVPLVVHFASNVEEAQSWFWEFGDGGTSTEPMPVYTYTASGQFTVRLEVVLPTGASLVREKANFITVTEAASWYVSTNEGGLWTAPETWIGGEVPPYGVSVDVAGPVIYNLHTEVDNLTVREGASLVAQSDQEEYPLSLIVMGNLINHGRILTDNILEETGLMIGVIGNVENHGIIAINTLALFGPMDETQTLSGQGTFGYHPELNLGNLNGLMMLIMRVDGNLTLNSIPEFTGVVLSVMEPFALRIIEGAELHFNATELGMQSMIMLTQVQGGVIIPAPTTLVFGGSLADLRVMGNITMMNQLNIKGTVDVQGAIYPYIHNYMPTEFLKRAKRADVVQSEINRLSIEGNLTVASGVFIQPHDDLDFDVIVTGSVTSNGVWAPTQTNIIGENDQLFEVAGQAAVLSAIHVEANIPNSQDYQWFFNDQVLPNQTNQRLTIEPPLGTWNGELYALSPVGRSRTITLNMTGGDVFTANFYADVTEGAAPLTVHFTDASNGAETWFWEFGDGSTSTEQHPVYTYEQPGVFEVRLEVTKGEERSFISKEAFITVHGSGVGAVVGRVTDATNGTGLPNVTVTIATSTTLTNEEGFYRIENIPEATLQAMFTANPTAGEVPMTVYFTNLSVDGTHSVYAQRDGYNDYYYRGLTVPHDAEITFNFSMSPIMTETELRFVLNWGEVPRDLDAHTSTPDGHFVYYGNRGSLTDEPYVALDHDVVTGYGPETMTFARLINGTYHYFIFNYSNEASMVGSGAVVQIYNRQGFWRSVSIPEQGEGRYWNVAQVDGATGEITIINQIQETSPSVAKQALDVKRTMEEPDRYTWHFGDGAESNEENPVYTYTSPGLYSVTLVVNNGENVSTHTISDMIRVIDPATELLARNDTVTVVAGSAIRINMLENDLIPADTWVTVHFMNLHEINHGMALPTFDMRSLMYISDANSTGIDRIVYSISNETESSQATILVRVVPGAYTNQAPYVMLPLELSILEDSTFSFPISKVVVDDNDTWQALSYSIASSKPQSVFTQLNVETGLISIQAAPDWWGTANVVLRATDTQGLSRADSMIVTFIPVNDPPVAQFIIAEHGLQESGYVVAFRDESQDNKDPEGAIVAWLWDFGDGNTSTQQHPVYTYTEMGTFTVSLRVTDNGGLTSSYEKDLDVVITSTEREHVYTLALHGNYPNPFNPSTLIRFELPGTAQVTLTVYNTVGQRVATLVNGRLTAGRYEIPMNGESMASGVYLYVLEYGNQRLVKKMTLLK